MTLTILPRNYYPKFTLRGPLRYKCLKFSEIGQTKSSNNKLVLWCRYQTCVHMLSVPNTCAKPYFSIRQEPTHMRPWEVSVYLRLPMQLMQPSSSIPTIQQLFLNETVVNAVLRMRKLVSLTSTELQSSTWLNMDLTKWAKPNGITQPNNRHAGLAKMHRLSYILLCFTRKKVAQGMAKDHI